VCAACSDFIEILAQRLERLLHALFGICLYVINHVFLLIDPSRPAQS
jgi:hypothetical protein